MKCFKCFSSGRKCLSKKGSILCALKWREWSEVLILWITNCIYSARTMYVIPVAAFFLQGCRIFSGYHPSLGLSKSSPSTVGCLLVKHMLSQPNTELPYYDSGFYTHTLMHTEVDTSRKFPVFSPCAVECSVWEHWPDLASVWSTLTVV